MTCEMMQPFVKASSYYAEHRLLFQLLVVFALAMQALDSFCFTLVYCVKTYGIRTAVIYLSYSSSVVFRLSSLPPKPRLHIICCVFLNPGARCRRDVHD